MKGRTAKPRPSSLSPPSNGARPLEGLDVMILAAGLGQRMLPLSQSLPKPLLPVLGRSMLAWNLRWLAAQGARRVVINTFHLAPEIDAYVQEPLARDFADPGAPPKPEVRLVRELILLGTAGGLGNAAPLLRSDPVLVWNVDLLYRPDLASALSVHRESAALATLLVTKSPQHAKISLRGNQVLDVAAEANPADPALWTYTGVLFLAQEGLAELPAHGFAELPPYLRAWTGRDRLRGCAEDAAFLEVGTLESYLRVHQEIAGVPDLLSDAPVGIRLLESFGWVDGSVEVPDDAIVEDSVVLSGAVVQRGAVVRRSILGPDGIAEGEVFGECRAHGAARPLRVLSRTQEGRFRAFLERHREIWPRPLRRVQPALAPLHGDGSGRQLVRVMAGGHAHVLIAPASSEAPPAPAGAPPPGVARALPGTPEGRDEEALPIYPRRVGPGVPDEPATFVYVAGLLAARGIRVPAIRLYDEESGILLVEDLGDRTLYDVVRSGPEERTRDLYREAVSMLVALQRDAAPPFDPERVLSPSYTEEFALSFECGYFQREMISGHLGGPAPSPALAEEYAEIARKAATTGNQVLIHRDFQSRNLMVTREGLALIDFQGARLGPQLYDLASLIHDPYVELEAELRDDLVRLFCEHAGIEEEVRAALVPVALCRLMQALGAYAYLGARLGKPGFLEHAPRAMARVAALAANDFPHLARLAGASLERLNAP